MLYTYCLIPNEQATVSLPQGFLGDLNVIGETSIVAVVEPELPLEELEKDDQRLMQAVIHHDQVICELFQKTALLPLRFGTYFPKEQDLLDHLTENANIYEKKLEELANKIELNLKLNPLPFPEEESTQKPEKGRAYLKAKKQKFDQKNNYQKQQQTELINLKEKLEANYSQLIQGESQDKTERFYLLIHQAHFSALKEQIERWKTNTPTWEIELTAPLPPYHFI